MFFGKLPFLKIAADVKIRRFEVFNSNFRSLALCEFNNILMAVVSAFTFGGQKFEFVKACIGS